MKKVFVFLFTLLLICPFVSYTSFADGIMYIDHLTDKESGEMSTMGTSPPSGSKEWELSVGSYNMSFDFERAVFTNYNLETSTGTIKVSTDFTSDQPDHVNADAPIEVQLYARKTIGSELISIKEVKRDGTDSVTFSKLDTDKLYYIRFSKAGDGVTITGDGKVTQ